jgi:hypothetical protein
LNAFDGSAAAGFGISLALGLLASTMADQTFWQKAWALKPTTMARTSSGRACGSIRSRSCWDCSDW